MKRLSGLLAGLVALAFAGAAPAATVEITINTTLSGGSSSIDCDGACQGFWDSGYSNEEIRYPAGPPSMPRDPYTGFVELALSPPADVDGDFFATAWDLDPASEPAVTWFLNSMLAELGRDLVEFATVEKIDGQQPAGFTFSTSQEYFWVKQGVWTAFFVNPTPGQLVTVTVFGEGLSNYGVAGVPIPAAFILFGSGLVGLGWLARRQRARKEESVT